MKSIVLPAGTEHVQYGDLAHLIADALWPAESDQDDRMAYGAARVNLDAELKKAAKTRALPVKDPLTLGPHTYPVGAALMKALVTVADLREFVADRGLSVQFQYTINDDGCTTTFVATPDLCAAMVAERKHQREARHKVGHYTMFEAAEVLQSVNGRDAKAFLFERMVPAVASGELRLTDPKDGGKVVGRACRPYQDWVTPPAIDEWLARAPFAYRWPHLEAKHQPESANTPEIAKSAKPDGRLLIQAEAYALWLRLKASGANPSVNSICEPMAKWCADTGTTTHTGVTPRAGTIRNTILGGSSGWEPPKHTREQAKKELAQLAQVAQSKSA